MKKITLRRALLGLAAAAVAAVIVYKLIDLGPKLLTPKPPPGRIAPAARGGPPETLMDAFRGEDTCLVACGEDAVYLLQLDGFSLGLSEYTVEFGVSGAIISQGVSANTGTRVVWDSEALALYSSAKEDGDYPMLGRYDWSWTTEGDGTGCLTLTRLEDESSRLRLLPEATEFYTITLTQPQDPEPGEGKNPVDQYHVLRGGNRFGMGRRTLGDLPRIYFARRQQPDLQGDLSGLLRRWRGDSAVLTFMANGVDPSFATRAACAAAVGIPDYTGTAEQNARLLDALGAGADPEKTEFLS